MHHDSEFLPLELLPDPRPQDIRSRCPFDSKAAVFGHGHHLADRLSPRASLGACAGTTNNEVALVRQGRNASSSPTPPPALSAPRNAATARRRDASDPPALPARRSALLRAPAQHRPLPPRSAGAR